MESSSASELLELTIGLMKMTQRIMLEEAAAAAAMTAITAVADEVVEVEEVEAADVDGAKISSS